MKSTLLASSALALVLSTGISFAGPTATITDAGSSNVNEINQSGLPQHSATKATIEQLSGSNGGDLGYNAYIVQAGAGQSTSTIKQHSGTGNRAYINQADTADDAKPSEVKVHQAGNGNESDIYQAGNGNTVEVRQGIGSNFKDAMPVNSGYAYVNQAGDGNTATVQDVRIGSDGSDNDAWITQTGNSNIAVVSQNGAVSDHAGITQTGTTNIASATQFGNSSFIDINQAADGNNAQVTQMGTIPTTSFGTNNDVDIWQDGNDVANVTQAGGDDLASIDQRDGTVRNTATVLQTGLTDRAYVYQYGNNGISTVTQSGSGHTATVWQTGDTDLATLTQSGITNLAYVSQASTLDKATLTQSGSNNNANLSQGVNNVEATILQSGNNNNTNVNQLNNVLAVANVTQSGVGGTATINQ